MSVIHDQHQTGTHSRGRGRPRFGRYAFSPAADQAQGHDLLTTSPSFGWRRRSGLLSFSISQGCSPAVGDSSRRDGSNNRAELLPSHSQNLRQYVPTRTEGAVAIVQNLIGEIRKDV